MKIFKFKLTILTISFFVSVSTVFGFGVEDVVKKPADTFSQIIDEPLEELPDFCVGESIEGRFGDCFEDDEELHQIAGRAWGNMYKDMIDAGIIDEEILNKGDSWLPYMPEITGWQADIKIYPEKVKISSGSSGAIVVVVNKGLEPVIVTEIDIDGKDKENFEIVKENCIGKPLTEFSTAGCGILIKATDAGKADLRIFFNIVGKKEVPIEKEAKNEGGCSFSSKKNDYVFISFLFLIFIFLILRKTSRSQTLYKLF